MEKEFKIVEGETAEETLARQERRRKMREWPENMKKDVADLGPSKAEVLGTIVETKCSEDGRKAIFTFAPLPVGGLLPREAVETSQRIKGPTAEAMFIYPGEAGEIPRDVLEELWKQKTSLSPMHVTPTAFPSYRPRIGSPSYLEDLENAARAAAAVYAGIEVEVSIYRKTAPLMGALLSLADAANGVSRALLDAGALDDRVVHLVYPEASHPEVSGGTGYKSMGCAGKKEEGR